MELASEETTEEKHSCVWQAKAKAADFVPATLPARIGSRSSACVCVCDHRWPSFLVQQKMAAKVARQIMETAMRSSWSR